MSGEPLSNILPSNPDDFAKPFALDTDKERVQVEEFSEIPEPAAAWDLEKSLTSPDARILIAGDPSVWRANLAPGACGPFDFSICLSGTEALAQASVESPDLIVIDLPEEGASQRLLMSIRGDSRLAGIPCMLFIPEPAMGDPTAWIRSAMSAGADDCLPRPFHLDEFLTSARARINRQQTIARHVLGRRESFEEFSAKLPHAIGRNLPVTDILQIVARRMKSMLQSPLTTCSLSNGGLLETVEAAGVPTRLWSRFDSMLGPLRLGKDPVPIPTELSGLLQRLRFPFVQDQFPTHVWKLAIHNPDGGVLGAFFVFFKPAGEGENWILPATREAINHKCDLTAVVLDRQRLHAELNKQTHFDTLTGLPNRTEFDRHLLQALERAKLTGGRFAMLMLDIDRFHRINEVRGYEAADHLLIEIAERLRQACRPGDLLARVAGDEFAVLVADAMETDNLRRIAQNLLDTFSRPFHLIGARVLVSASVGISQFPGDGQSMGKLVNSCEIALSAARRQQGAHIAFFHSGMVRQTIEGEEIETYLTEALRANRFELHFQPQFAVKGTLTGFEALIRLRTPDNRIIGPGAFLSAAEDAGMIIPIGQWVMEAAFRQANSWKSSSIGPQRLAINVAAQQLTHSNFVESIREMIQRYRIDPRTIEFEITESSLMVDLQSSGTRLEQLKSLGVNISIDDFGTGYSSLSYLHEFPIDKVKIDQSFVQRIHSQNSALPIIEAIIALSRSLGASVLAEGVETSEQYTALEVHGCNEVQGYLFARPMGVEAANAFVLGHGQHDTSWFTRMQNEKP